MSVKNLLHCKNQVDYKMHKHCTHTHILYTHSVVKKKKEDNKFNREFLFHLEINQKLHTAIKKILQCAHME